MVLGVVAHWRTDRGDEFKVGQRDKMSGKCLTFWFLLSIRQEFGAAFLHVLLSHECSICHGWLSDWRAVLYVLQSLTDRQREFIQNIFRPLQLLIASGIWAMMYLTEKKNGKMMSRPLKLTSFVGTNQFNNTEVPVCPSEEVLCAAAVVYFTLSKSSPTSARLWLV